MQPHKRVPRQRTRYVRPMAPRTPIAVVIKRDVLDDFSMKRVDLVERRRPVFVQEEAVVHLDARVGKADDLTLAQEACCENGSGRAASALYVRRKKKRVGRGESLSRGSAQQ